MDQCCSQSPSEREPNATEKGRRHCRRVWKTVNGKTDFFRYWENPAAVSIVCVNAAAKRRRKEQQGWGRPRTRIGQSVCRARSSFSLCFASFTSSKVGVHSQKDYFWFAASSRLRSVPSYVKKESYYQMGQERKNSIHYHGIIFLPCFCIEFFFSLTIDFSSQA